MDAPARSRLAPTRTRTSRPSRAAVTKDGQFVEATTSTFGLTFHFGLTTATPTTTRARGTAATTTPGIARRRGDGADRARLVLERGPTAGSAAGQGMFLQADRAERPRRRAPARARARSARTERARSRRCYRTPVTGRLGAPGVFLVYGAGYPTLHEDRRCSASERRRRRCRFRSPRAQGANLAAAPQGRLWLFWKRDTVIYATRTNKAVTRIEPVSAVAPPPGTDTVWRLNGEGSLGPLDLVANVQTTRRGVLVPARAAAALAARERARRPAGALRRHRRGRPARGREGEAARPLRDDERSGVATCTRRSERAPRPRRRPATSARRRRSSSASCSSCECTSGSPSCPYRCHGEERGSA